MSSCWLALGGGLALGLLGRELFLERFKRLSVEAGAPTGFGGGQVPKSETEGEAVRADEPR